MRSFTSLAALLSLLVVPMLVMTKTPQESAARNAQPTIQSLGGTSVMRD